MLNPDLSGAGQQDARQPLDLVIERGEQNTPPDAIVLDLGGQPYAGDDSAVGVVHPQLRCIHSHK